MLSYLSENDTVQLTAQVIPTNPEGAFNPVYGYPDSDTLPQLCAHFQLIRVGNLPRSSLQEGSRSQREAS